MKRNAAIIVLASLLATGCATSRNYQPELDALNAKVDSLKSELQAKTKENGALSDQVRELQRQLEIAERERQAAQGRSSASKSGYDKQSTSAPSSDPYAK